MSGESNGNGSLKSWGQIAAAVVVLGTGGFSSYSALSGKLDDVKTSVVELKVQVAQAEKANSEVSAVTAALGARASSLETKAATYEERLAEALRRVRELEAKITK